MIGMPLKLMVSFLLIGLMLPTIVCMVSTVEEQSSEVDTGTGCSAVEDCIYRVFRSGSGSMETVHLDLGPKETIVLGGTGADAHSIRLYVNEELRKTVYLDRAPVLLEERVSEIVGSVDVTFGCTMQDRRLVVGVVGRSSSPCPV